jgi:glycine cleavage system H lipoate-binding protein
MVALFVVLMIALFLAVDVVLQLRGKPALADRIQARLEGSAEGGAVRVAGFRVAPDALYHPGHTWARREAAGVAKVGLDDFAARLVGPPDQVEAPAVGTPVRAGRPLLTVQRRGRRTTLLSPVSGTVAAVNKDALAQPSAITADPYGRGWLVEVRSPDMTYDLRSLLSGDMARRFVDEAAAALHSYFAPADALPAAADGGEPLDAIGDLMDEATWDRVRARFLLTDSQ